CRDERRVSRGVIRGRDLDEIRTDEAQPGATPNNLERLDRRQAADLRRAGTRREGRIEAINVEGNIDWTGAHLLPDLRHQWRQALMPAFFRLNHPKAAPPRPVEVGRSVTRAAQANLHAAAGIEQAILKGSAERRAMGNRLAEHVFADVGMRVHMNEP